MFLLATEFLRHDVLSKLDWSEKSFFGPMLIVHEAVEEYWGLHTEAVEIAPGGTFYESHFFSCALRLFSRFLTASRIQRGRRFWVRKSVLWGRRVVV